MIRRSLIWMVNSGKLSAASESATVAIASASASIEGLPTVSTSH